MGIPLVVHVLLSRIHVEIDYLEFQIVFEELLIHLGETNRRRRRR